MATLEPFTLLQPGVFVTPASEAFTGAANVSVNTIMADEVIKSPDALKITTLALEQTIDDGRTWTALAVVAWQSDPNAAPRNPGDPLPRPGLSTSVPADGKTRRFRARIDVPQALQTGIDVTVSPA